MHRDLEMTVPSSVTDDLLNRLADESGVISLAVHRGDSVKPPGDVISAQVLNGDVDAVIALVERTSESGSISIATSTVDSLIDSDNGDTIRTDVDEAIWEEVETAMRRHTRPTANWLLTTAGGGLVAACALVSHSHVTEATALVAAAIIAPVFEPLARIALSAVNRHPGLLVRAVASMLLSYAILVAVAVVTMLVLRSGSHGFVHEFAHNTSHHEVDHPPAINYLISAAGAVTGVVMVSAGRFTQLAGPLVALQLLPAAASLGMSLELGEGDAALHSLGRLGIDVGMVIVAGLIVFLYKHIRAHDGRATAR
jgi:hypothetical protein